MHLIKGKQVLASNSFLLKSLYELHLIYTVKLELGNESFELSDLVGTLLRLEFDNKVFEFLNSLNKSLGVLSNRVLVISVFRTVLAVSETHEVLEVSLESLHLVIGLCDLLL